MNTSEWKRILDRAKAGDVEAQFEVGVIYNFGFQGKSGKVIVRKNMPAAKRWFHKAAKASHPGAQRGLADMASSDPNDKKALREAIKLYNLAIASGDAIAAHNLGNTLRDLGKKKEAFEAYTKAVSLGDSESLLTVALCYAMGYGTKQNLNKARSSLEKMLKAPAEHCTPRGVEYAHYWLAVLHLLGLDGKKRSFASARKLLSIANRDSDHESANDLLNIIGKYR
jgi:TPR repeat protein